MLSYWYGQFHVKRKMVGMLPFLHGGNPSWYYGVFILKQDHQCKGYPPFANCSRRSRSANMSVTYHYKFHRDSQSEKYIQVG